MLARRIAIAKGFGDLHRTVEQLEQGVSGHGHRRTLDCGKRVDFLLRPRRDPSGIRPDALHDCGKIVFRGIEQSRKHMDRFDGGVVLFPGNAHCSLDGLLGGQG